MAKKGVDCSELASVITQIAMNLASRGDARTLDDVVAQMQQSQPQLTRDIVADSITEATTGRAAQLDDLSKTLNAIKSEARGDAQLRDSADEIRSHLRAGTLRPARPGPKAVSGRIKELRGIRDDLLGQLSKSEPAEKKRILKQIESIEETIRTGKQSRARRSEVRATGSAELKQLRERLETLRDTRNKTAAQARTEESLRERIETVKGHIKSGTIPERADSKTEVPDRIKSLRETLNGLEKQLAASEPARKQRLLKQIAAIENVIESGDVRTSAPVTAEEQSSPELAALEEQLDGLRKKRNKTRRDAQTIEGLNKTIADLRGNIEAGTLPETTKRVADVSVDIQKLRGVRDSLRRKIANSTPAKRKRLEEQIAQLDDVLKSGDIVPPVSRNVGRESAELERLGFERDQRRAAISAQINKMKPRGLWSIALNDWNVVRAIMTSGEFSAVGRQAAPVLFGRPTRVLGQLGPMFQAAGSKLVSERIHAELLDRPLAPFAARSDLYMAPIDGSASLSEREEKFATDLAKRIPIVAASERAYITLLNTVRAQHFDALINTVARNREATPEEGRAIAFFVNTATGRGTLGQLEAAAVGLNAAFFSPRYLAARFQYLSGYPIWGKRGRDAGARAQLVMAEEYVRTMAGISLVMGLIVAAGGSVERDPRSSDFGKIKIGKTRIDLMGGMSQIAVFAARMYTGETKSSTTRKVRSIRGEDVPYGADDAADFIWRFTRSKFSPGVGLGVSLAAEEDVIGRPKTLKTAEGALDIAGDLFVPMTWHDIRDVYREHDIPDATMISLLAMFGAGVQVYEDRNKEKKRTKR